MHLNIELKLIGTHNRIISECKLEKSNTTGPHYQ